MADKSERLHMSLCGESRRCGTPASGKFGPHQRPRAARWQIQLLPNLFGSRLCLREDFAFIHAEYLAILNDFPAVHKDRMNVAAVAREHEIGNDIVNR